MGQSAGKIFRRSPLSCVGPPLQFHTVHGDNIRLSRDRTLARRFHSFCRAITFSSRPVHINERIYIKFSEISNNWSGGLRFGFTNNDPVTLNNALPRFAMPDLTIQPGFWAKTLDEQYCEKDNILYYYVNSSGDVIYGINNVEIGVILTGIDTHGPLWVLIDLYGNCTAIELLDTVILMHPRGGVTNNLNATNAAGLTNTLPGSQISLNSHHPIQQSRRSLPANEQDLDRHVMNSMQSLNIGNDHTAFVNDLASGVPPLRYNATGRLIPVPFHITKGRNVRLSHDRFIASRTEKDFCQGYVFTARPIRIGEKIIVQILKTEQIYAGALALGLTSCNPGTLQAGDLPNDSDFLLDRPEYWVVSKDIASIPQCGDEISFFVSPNGEVTISKNNGPGVVVMHVDQSLQLWAFLDIYGSTQSVRMFRQQLPSMIAYPQMSPATSSTRFIPASESLNSLNNQTTDARKLLHPSQLNVTHSTISTSSSTLASMQSNNVGIGSASTSCTPNNINGANSLTATATTTGHTISVPLSGDMIQIQPNNRGTVLVVNLPPTTSQDLNGTTFFASQSRLNQPATSGVLAGACSSNTIVSNASSQYIEPINNVNNGYVNHLKDTVDHSNSDSECTICYENQIDSVLYMCGHMCMCYDCAIEQWRGAGGGQCPLCRAVIRDVIRTYTT
ncbi:protein neuralized isoform X2 [Teleopsis dalmanni]|uniref:protein neuralized isoform X2 n=1 Tax=Teleopsis dalmanni TaxID=139649 RepID=UPI0018CDD65E|nr:protein neuralized isoform X2 [Teleopsis dalmanni]